MGKVIKANFDQLSGNEITTESRYQYDYGMILKFGGAVTLPQAYEVHFALDKTGDAVTQIGGADGVAVPDSMFTSGAPIYAWVYLHDSETDGYTQYTAIIPVIKRAAPSDLEPTPVQQSAIDQAIAALGVAVEQTAADVEATAANAENAQASAEAAANSAAEAAETAEGVETNVTAAQAAKAAAESARDRAVQAETAAASSETNAAASATAAGLSETAAKTAETGAQTSATAAANSASAALTSEENANGAMMSAYSDANRAETAATTATNAKTDAVSAKNAAVSAKTAAETAAGTATTKATAAANSATAAANSATAAAGSATEAATTAQGISEHLDQIDENTDAIEGLKEDFSTLNSEGTVPTSEQMLSENVTVDSVPYHFRKTASDNADREELEIVGGSVAWNQLVQNGNFADSSGWGARNGSISVSNGIATVTPTVDGTLCGLTGNSNAYFDVSANHKYVMLVDILSPINSTLTLAVGGVASGQASVPTVPANAWTKAGTVFTYEQAMKNGFFALIRESLSTTQSIQYKNAQCYDVTAMFGPTIADHIYTLEQTTAGAGVALFRSLFNKDFYPYDSGSMQNVSGLSEHVTVGFNQWDEEWEVGTYNNNGEKVSASDQIRCKNPVRVFPNTSYYFKASAGNRIVFIGSDGAKVGSALYDKQNSIITTPANAEYLVFNIATAYGTTYNHDICINISDTSKNGTYEPYDGHSYALDDSLTLRGIPTLVDGKIKFDGDIYLPSGKVTRRYGIVDLGTLNWTYLTPAGAFQYGYFWSYIAGKANGQLNIFCKYATQSYLGDGADKACQGNNENNRIYIVDSAYTDAATFKAALSGVYMVYELATPTTEQADPYVSPQICDPTGTEEFVSTGIVPVGHTTKYPDNMRAKLDGLPWNFASLIAPTESGFKATRNYTTGNLLIVNNVLYKATANIANGGTITVGTNVTVTTLAEVIAALS